MISEIKPLPVIVSDTSGLYSPVKTTTSLGNSTVDINSDINTTMIILLIYSSSSDFSLINWYYTTLIIYIVLMLILSWSHKDEQSLDFAVSLLKTENIP